MRITILLFLDIYVIKFLVYFKNTRLRKVILNVYIPGFA
jgi:hypothetical protein